MSSSKGAISQEMTSQEWETRLNQWKTHIDAIKRSYIAEAMHIGDVETRLDEAQHKLYNWIANVKLMQKKQNLLAKELDFIDERQTELSEEVAKIDISEERGADSSIATTIDDINEKLSSLNIEISKRSSEDVSGSKIVVAKILNAQLSALEALSQSIGQIRRDVDCCDYDELGSVFENSYLRST